MRAKVPYLTTDIEDDIIITLNLIFLWWLIGFTVLVYQIVSLWIFVKLLLLSIKNTSDYGIPKLVIFPVLFVVIYGISLIINFQQSELQRTVASIYNYSFWFMGIFLIIVVYRKGTMELIRRMGRAFERIIAVTGILAIFSLLLWLAGVKNIHFRTPLLILLPRLESIPLIQQSLTINMIGADWFAFTSLPRLLILSPYPTALAAILIMMLPLYLSTQTTTTARSITIGGLGTLSMIFTLSRTAIIAFIVASVYVYILNKKHRLGFVLLIFSAILIMWPVMTITYDYFSDLRKGSSSLRVAMYQETINTALKKSPVIGIGIKPRETGALIPIGSHSMILSVFLRTGLLGLCAFVAMQWSLARTWYRGLRQMHGDARKAWNAIGISLCAMMLWQFTEDLDAPQLVAFLYFLLIGTMAMLIKKETVENVESYTYR